MAHRGIDYSKYQGNTPLSAPQLDTKAIHNAFSLIERSYDGIAKNLIAKDDLALKEKKIDADIANAADRLAFDKEKFAQEMAFKKAQAARARAAARRSSRRSRSSAAQKMAAQEKAMDLAMDLDKTFAEATSGTKEKEVDVYKQEEQSLNPAAARMAEEYADKIGLNLAGEQKMSEKDSQAVIDHIANTSWDQLKGEAGVDASAEDTAVTTEEFNNTTGTSVASTPIGQSEATTTPGSDETTSINTTSASDRVANLGIALNDSVNGSDSILTDNTQEQSVEQPSIPALLKNIDDAQTQTINTNAPQDVVQDPEVSSSFNSHTIAQALRSKFDTTGRIAQPGNQNGAQEPAVKEDLYQDTGFTPGSDRTLLEDKNGVKFFAPSKKELEFAKKVDSLDAQLKSGDISEAEYKIKTLELGKQYGVRIEKKDNFWIDEDGKRIKISEDKNPIISFLSSMNDGLTHVIERGVYGGSRLTDTGIKVFIDAIEKAKKNNMKLDGQKWLSNSEDDLYLHNNIKFMDEHGNEIPYEKIKDGYGKYVGQIYVKAPKAVRDALGIDEKMSSPMTRAKIELELEKRGNRLQQQESGNNFDPVTQIKDIRTYINQRAKKANDSSIVEDVNNEKIEERRANLAKKIHELTAGKFMYKTDKKKKIKVRKTPEEQRKALYSAAIKAYEAINNDKTLSRRARFATKKAVTQLLNKYNKVIEQRQKAIQAAQKDAAGRNRKLREFEWKERLKKQLEIEKKQQEALIAAAQEIARSNTKEARLEYDRKKAQLDKTIAETAKIRAAMKKNKDK